MPMELPVQLKGKCLAVGMTRGITLLMSYLDVVCYIIAKFTQDNLRMIKLKYFENMSSL